VNATIARTFISAALQHVTVLLWSQGTPVRASDDDDHNVDDHYVRRHYVDWAEYELDDRVGG